jgi:hypothetical protein
MLSEPAERLARRRGTRAHFRFAAEAQQALPASGPFLLAASHRGLHVLAPCEATLALPIGQLRHRYGDEVQISDPVPGEPVLRARLGVELTCAKRVVAALRRRGINPSEEFVGTHYCILRFDARVAPLIGWPQEMAALSAGRASQVLLMAGYEPTQQTGRAS